MFHVNNLLESSGWPGYAGEYPLRLRCLHCALLLVTSCHLYGLCKKSSGFQKEVQQGVLELIRIIKQR